MPPHPEDEVAFRLQEFRDFVWNHAEDAFQAKFDICPSLDDEEVALFLELLDGDDRSDVDELAERVTAVVGKAPSFLERLLQVVGLTRNKIIQDIKGYARAKRYLDIQFAQPSSLFRTARGRDMASKYLAAQILRVFGPSRDVTADMLEAMNQATWPGYIRQERAKRMGHEAEYRLACLLRDFGIPFAPEDKAINPLCADAMIDGMSYDLVSPSANDARLRIVSTTHTANIGQYGESKDELEIRKAVAAMTEAGDRDEVVLLAFVDGVGFESNLPGLTGVLRQSDEFCQFSTIWKAGAIAAFNLGFSTVVAISEADHERFSAFCDRYDVTLFAREEGDPIPDGFLPAGDAYMKINR